MAATSRSEMARELAHHHISLDYSLWVSSALQTVMDWTQLIDPFNASRISAPVLQSLSPVVLAPWAFGLVFAKFNYQLLPAFTLFYPLFCRQPFGPTCSSKAQIKQNQAQHRARPSSPRPCKYKLISMITHLLHEPNLTISVPVSNAIQIMC